MLGISEFYQTKGNWSNHVPLQLHYQEHDPPHNLYRPHHRPPDFQADMGTATQNLLDRVKDTHNPRGEAHMATLDPSWMHKSTTENLVLFPYILGTTLYHEGWLLLSLPHTSIIVSVCRSYISTARVQVERN